MSCARLSATANGDRPHVARLGEDRLFLDADELLALRLFDRPRPVDEALLQRAEITALPEPRESLALWLRRGVLVTGG